MQILEMIVYNMSELGNWEGITSMRADSGDKGSPSSQTTKSETSSITPVPTKSRVIISGEQENRGSFIQTEDSKIKIGKPLFRRTGIPCLRRNGSISCVNCSNGPSINST